ncbi:hypothetical protein ACH5RR_021625 [Cinchona calisaya]|uniref:Uncharacterized protein n=1 Tax=Cinchona calisaya TaxID=153742 RepID=A0ABD2ZHT7_9GENT
MAKIFERVKVLVQFLSKIEVSPCQDVIAEVIVLALDVYVDRSSGIGVYGIGVVKGMLVNKERVDVPDPLHEAINEELKVVETWERSADKNKGGNCYQGKSNNWKIEYGVLGRKSGESEKTGSSWTAKMVIGMTVWILDLDGLDNRSQPQHGLTSRLSFRIKSEEKNGNQMPCASN